MCIQAGGYKTNALKEKPEPLISKDEAKKVIAESQDEDALCKAINRLTGKWKKYSPEYLEHLLDSEHNFVLWGLMDLISEHLHPLSVEYFKVLAKHHDEDVREDAIEQLEQMDISKYGINDN